MRRTIAPGQAYVNRTSSNLTLRTASPTGLVVIAPPVLAALLDIEPHLTEGLAQMLEFVAPEPAIRTMSASRSLRGYRADDDRAAISVRRRAAWPATTD